MQTLFKGVNIEECLEEASKSLNLEIEDINYEVVKEVNKFFKKEVIISVSVIDVEAQGKIKIENNNIIVTNPKAEGEAAFLRAQEYLILKVDGKIVRDKVRVFEHSLIEVIFPEENAERHLKIKVSEDKVEAYMEIQYVPERKYKLKNSEESSDLTIEIEIESETMPPKYNFDEVIEELSKMGIIYGIMEENIKKNVETNCSNILIARGDKSIDGKDDVIEYKFPMDENLLKLIEDEKGNVDFKNICSIKSVLENDIIGIRKEGEKGRDGKNIFGNIIKHKTGKTVYLKVGQGCFLKDNNTVIATIEGKPSTRNNVFYVNKLHEVKGDIDLTTGNVKFIGDVVIYGNVKEGMEVIADNSISIAKHVDRALIKGKGDISITGNVISSNIIGGGEDVSKINYIGKLTEILNIIQSIVKNVEDIKKYDIMNNIRKDGEIIKVLIETKHKNVPKLYFQIMKDIKLNEDLEAEKRILPILKEKLLGLGPISIKNVKELEILNNLIINKINILKEELSVPVNVQINYCQDCEVNSSGNIYVNGKGSYISLINANDSIYFTKENSAVRGGVLRAKNEIKCGIVGSVGGVTTKLMLGEGGHIWVRVAYQNTIFTVGQKEFLLEVPSKDVHAYLDNKGDLIVDRFIL